MNEWSGKRIKIKIPPLFQSDSESKINGIQQEKKGRKRKEKQGTADEKNRARRAQPNLGHASDLPSAVLGAAL